MRYLTILLLFFIFSSSAFGITVTWDGGGDGVHWSDADNWNPNILPQAEDFVFISQKSVEVDIDVRIKKLQLDGASIEIQAVDFSIGSNGEGIHSNNSQIHNYGSVYIQTGSIGVVLDGNSRLFNYQEIEIVEGTIGIEIRMNAELINESFIKISESHSGIYSASLIENKSGATILIEESGTTATGMFSDTLATVNNHGTIDIRNSGLVGMRSYGLLNNFNLIELKDCFWGILTSHSTINDTPSKIVNNSGAIIKIDTESNLFHTNALDSVINNGFIGIVGENGTGITSSGYFINNDSIMVQMERGSQGILNANEFVNSASGRVQVLGNITGIANTKDFTNHGEIVGVGVETGIENNPTGKFTCAENSSIEINNPMEFGLVNLGDFNLEGDCRIVNGQGAGLLNNGHMTIHSSGSLIMSGISDYLFEHFTSNQGTFTVNGIFELNL